MSDSISYIVVLGTLIVVAYIVMRIRRVYRRAHFVEDLLDIDLRNLQKLLQGEPNTAKQVLSQKTSEACYLLARRGVLLCEKIKERQPSIEGIEWYLMQCRDMAREQLDKPDSDGSIELPLSIPRVALRSVLSPSTEDWSKLNAFRKEWNRFVQEANLLFDKEHISVNVR